MGSCALLHLPIILHSLLLVISHCSSVLELSTGNSVMIPIPPYYQVGFLGRAFLGAAGDAFPPFKAALSVEAVDGKYLCSLVVLLGDLKAWASDHRSGFEARGRCVLELTRDGELRLVDSGGAVGWSSNTTGRRVKRLHLTGTGNLVLLDPKNRTKWQSFDHPGDIMVWSQVLKAPSSAVTSPLRNSTSFYSLEVQHEKIALYANSNGSKYSYWELRPRTNESVSFVKLGSAGLKVLGTNGRKIAQLRPTSTEPVRFLALGTSGSLGLYHYSRLDSAFKASYRAPGGLCDLPSPCGPYGICTQTNSCSCMQFPQRQYASSPECNEGLPASDYCRVPLSSDMADMEEVDGVGTVLRTEPQKVNSTREECARSCINNCSCLAAMYTSNGSECFHYGAVGGVREIDRDAGVTYWVKVPSGTSRNDDGRSSGTKTRIMIAVGVVDAVAVCLIVGGVVYYRRVIRKKIASSRVEST